MNVALVIFASENGRDGWKPVMPADVPAWVKTPETIAKLVDGEMCCKCDEGDKGSLWYRGERNFDAERIALAQQKRELRSRKRLNDLAIERSAARDRVTH